MAKYRLITKWDYTGTTYELQVKRPWWPFWMYLARPGSTSLARDYAENDAARKRHKKTVVEIRVSNG